MEKDTLVYLHKRNDTGEVFYVGIGNSKRPYKKQHRTKYWKNIVNKHGYSIEIVKTGLSWDEACEEEIRLIKLYGRKDLGLGTLVNMTDGGEGGNGFKHSDEWKEHMSKKFSGKNNPFYGKQHSKEFSNKLKSIKSMLGKKHTQETKSLMSEKSKGKVKSQEHKKNMSLSHMEKFSIEDIFWIRENGVKGHKGNVTEIANKYNVSSRTIRDIINKVMYKYI